MRSLQPLNRVRIGVHGQPSSCTGRCRGPKLHQCPNAFRPAPSYYGQFANTGQLNKGDKVRITGVSVGKVEGLKIDGDHVVIEFSTGSNTIGTESRLAIKTDTVLGKKVLEIEPRGSQTLRPKGFYRWAKAPPRISSTTRLRCHQGRRRAGTSTPSSNR